MRNTYALIFIVIAVNVDVDVAIYAYVDIDVAINENSFVSGMLRPLTLSYM